MKNFTFECKTKIIFGKDTEKQVGEEISRYSKKILLHYGQSHIKKSGLYDRVVKSLNEAGVDYVELSGVKPNPRLKLVHEGIKLCRQNSLDFILAVGGGSVIDSAKAIALGYYYEGDVWDFFTKHMKVEKALPIATILTIPAAGSEASGSSVISHGNRKLAVTNNLIRPVFSILNPELTYSLPNYQTAAGITDMMAHIFERYFTNTKNVDLTDKLCESTLRSIIKNAKLVLKQPKNYDYRAEIMWASTIAHNDILGTGREADWATHRIEHELSAIYDITHGAGLAIMFPAWMKFVYKHDVDRFKQFAKNVWGLKGALEGIEATNNFFKEIGMPTSLKEVDIDDSKFEEMAKLCGNQGNFVKLKPEDIVEIYKLAL